MKIVIEIPEEFEEHFNKDKFIDSLERIKIEIDHQEWPINRSTGDLAKVFREEKPLLENGTKIKFSDGRIAIVRHDIHHVFESYYLSIDGKTYPVSLLIENIWEVIK